MSKLTYLTEAQGLQDDLTAFYDYLHINRDAVYPLLRQFTVSGKKILSQEELRKYFVNYCVEREDKDLPDSNLAQTIAMTQEVAVQPPWLYMAVRTGRSEWHYLRLDVENMDYELINVDAYLKFKEHLLGFNLTQDDWVLEFNLNGFDKHIARLPDSGYVGQGMEFYHRQMFSEVFADSGDGCLKLLGFLREHTYKGQQLLLSPRIQTLAELNQSVHFAREYLKSQSADASWSQVAFQLQAFGIEPGWGSTADRIMVMLEMLRRFIDHPDPVLLEKFLIKLPTLFSLVVVLPHGYLSQSNVLGLPDTGGQVVYILDQVRALETAMRQNLSNQGLDIQPEILVITRLIPEALQTTCSLAEEKIVGGRNASILRVPFKSAKGEVLNQWISRFEVWPYLERFAFDAEKEIISRMGRKPDLIIGNYTDGCLVASLLARRLQTMQCNIAHALEKARYQFSDVYWQENDDKYHFACQYTADLIAMNRADFIVTSTSHEIMGRDDCVGQYEYYKSFTLPGLYRVIDGIDLKDPRFNCVAPGVNSDIYFPYQDREKRLSGLESEITSLVFNDADKKSRGCFSDPNKRMLFTMARLDRIKNISGLVRWFSENDELQERSNLLIVAGHVDLATSYDKEEQEEIKAIHRLMDRYNLDDKVRWVGRRLEKNLAGELYRYIADMKGIFIQPALFEAFGLTVIEAMACGLPSFATRRGGPLEIIVDGVSGFHIDPEQGDQCAKIINRFFAQCEKDESYWEKLSEASIARIRENYTWPLYTERMMTLIKTQGFWNSVHDVKRQETDVYLDMFYGLQFRKLAAQMEKTSRRTNIDPIAIASVRY